MRTVVLDPLPAEVEQLIERRRRLGLDHHDEVWEGEYHMNPGPRPRHGIIADQVAVLLHDRAAAAGLLGTSEFNVGEEGDFRVPDHGYHRGVPDLDAAYVATAAMVVEIVSPGDETWEKLPFYAAHGVEEVLIVEPPETRVHIFALEAGAYEEVEASALLGWSASDLAAAIRWP